MIDFFEFTLKDRMDDLIFHKALDKLTILSEAYRNISNGELQTDQAHKAIAHLEELIESITSKLREEKGQC